MLHGCGSCHRWRNNRRRNSRRRSSVHRRDANRRRLKGDGCRGSSRLQLNRPRNRNMCGGRSVMLCRTCLWGSGTRGTLCNSWGSRGHVRQRGARHRAGSMLSLLSSRSGSTSAQFFAGRFARPRTRINLTHHRQPLLGLGECREVTHVQSEPLTPFLEAAAHKEGKTLQLRQFRMSQRHRRRRRA